MDLSNDSIASIPEPLLFNEEDLARLCRQLGHAYPMHTLTLNEQRIALQTIASGLRSMDPYPAAAQWAEVFTQLCTSATDWPKTRTAGEKHLIRVLLNQPAPSRPLHQQKQLRSLAARAVLLKTLHLHSPPASFGHGMAQLFRSSRPDWTSLSQVDFRDANALQAWEPPQEASDAALEFRDQLARLARMALPAPSLFKSVAASPTTAHREPHDSGGEYPNPLPSSPTVVRNDPQPPDASSNLQLFELQLKAETDPALVDGYRLELNWARLTPEELLPVLTRLNADLVRPPSDSNDYQRSAHAFARYLSLFCGLSLRNCWGLPLFRKGTMFYDAQQGVLRRDALLAAPRSAESGKLRTRGRWWRTRLPTEVVAVGRTLLARHPTARTLGELLEQEGVSYPACQVLLNAGCTTSHRPEDTRFAKSLRPCLLALSVHPAIVARIAGDWMTTPPSDHYYLLLAESQIHAGMVRFCHWAGLSPPPAPAKDKAIGSPNVPSQQQFKAAVAALNQLVLSARYKLTTRSPVGTIAEFHNLYAKAVALHLIWGTGGRANNFESLTFGHLFSADNYLLLSDRRVDPYAQHRICPSTRTLRTTRHHYIEHLQSMRLLLERAKGGDICAVFSPTPNDAASKPAFHLLHPQGTGWTAHALERSDLVELSRELGMGELNAARHFWFTALVRREVTQVAIDAMLGHHIQRAEPFGHGSGVSPRQLFDYLRPVLEEIQDELGFAPLIGRGRQAQRFLALPNIPAAETLTPIPNTRLIDKLKAQDTLVPDTQFVHQDPPVASQTLIAHSHLTRLRRAFLASPVVSRWPLGSLLFCLIAREVVLAQAEQEDLFKASVGDGAWSVDAMPVIESRGNGRPIGQRIVDQYTVAAMHLARATTMCRLNTFNAAREQLHQLLKALDPTWPTDHASQSQTLLSSMASHWSAVEVAPGTLFGVVHKAPFIPLEDLARLRYKRPCMTDSESAPPSRPQNSRRGAMFDELQIVVNRWADKDERLGDEQARQIGCTTELRSRLEEIPLDPVEHQLTQLLLADLSETPPYRQLKVTSLPEYLRGYRVYFMQILEEGIPDFDAETMRYVYQRMGGLPDILASCPARWQMLHINAFFRKQGIPLPFEFHDGNAKKPALPPRIPVYASRAEFDLVCDAIADAASTQGLSAVAAAARLRVQRSAPLRSGELRYLATADLDSQAGLMHITSTGHAHLKNKNSRGSAPVDIHLTEALAGLRQRQQQLDPSPRKLLFADDQRRDGYSGFDSVTDRAVAGVIALTGRTAFRPHDLRAAAVTDSAFHVEAVLQRLCAGDAVESPTLTADAVSKRSARFAHASRLARHGSTLTTLRYYYCSGFLDLREQLDQAAAGDSPSGKFVADLLKLQPQAIYARAHRLHSDSEQTTDWARFPALQTFIGHATACLPTPWLGKPQQQIRLMPVLASPTIDRIRVLQATQASFVGMGRRDAADRFDADEREVERIAEAAALQAANLGVKMFWTDARAPLIGRGLDKNEKGVGQVVQRLAAHMAEHPTWLAMHRPALLPCLASDGTRLIARTMRQLGSLLPVLRQLRAAGFLPVVRFGARVAPDEVNQCIRDGLMAGLVRHPVNSTKDWTASIRFVLCPNGEADCPTPQLAPRASARTLGRVGTLAIAALLISLALPDLNPQEETNHG